MIDNALARAIPTWRALGYEVVVTADHGMNAERQHGGMGAIMREVPFYYFGPEDVLTGAPAEGTELSPLGLAATILSRIGVTPPPDMRPAFLPGPGSVPA